MSTPEINEMSTLHLVECDKCKRVLYECDVHEGAIYESPLDYYDIAACPDCGHMLVYGNYSRIEA